VIIHVLLARYPKHAYRNSIGKLERSKLRKMEQELEKRRFK